MKVKPVWISPCSLNTAWIVIYANRAIDYYDADEAAFSFDIAVAGGIVFG